LSTSGCTPALLSLAKLREGFMGEQFSRWKLLPVWARDSDLRPPAEGAPHGILAAGSNAR
jgi:hypothetical protein